MRRVSPLLALAALVALAGCTPAPVPPAPGGASGAVGLVNLWRVAAEGESDATWLRLDAGEFQLWRDCGMIMGSWQASDTLMLASVYGASGGCVTSSIPEVPWIESLAGYRPLGAGWELLDADGATVATLRIDGAPDPSPDAAEFSTEPPEVTADVRSRFAATPDLPATLRPAGDLVGRWIPVDGPAGTDPHVEFHPDGRWTGSDGCNGGAGAVGIRSRRAVPGDRWPVDAHRVRGSGSAELGGFGAARRPGRRRAGAARLDRCGAGPAGRRVNGERALSWLSPGRPAGPPPR